MESPLPLPEPKEEDLEVSGGSIDETHAILRAVQLWQKRRRHYVAFSEAVQRCRRGSPHGRLGNRTRQYNVGLERLRRDYFGLNSQPPEYSEIDFQTRFRVPRSVFMRIYDDVKDLPYWKQKINATGRPQTHALQKVVSAFRVLGYGESTDRGDEYLRLSRSTCAIATQLLVDHITDNHESSYMRSPSDEELALILDRNAQRGMPGCIGRIDCSHWVWRMCPKALAGQYQNYKRRLSVVMETVL